MAMTKKETQAMFRKLAEKVCLTSEKDFLKYLIDCCENVLENPKIIQGIKFDPVMMQLLKLRAEVTQRLEVRFKTKYGKFATRSHLLAQK